MIEEARAAAEESAKSPWGYAWWQYGTTMLLSAFGGIVSWMKSERYGWRPFLGDMGASMFVGLVTFLACESLGVHGAAQAVCIAISSHMGTRALFLIRKKMFPWMGDEQ